jgi:hypothetical protein
MSPLTDLESEPVQHEVDPQLWAEVLKHPGKWVVLDDPHGGRIIEVGDDPRTLIERAVAMGVQNPVLIEVPSDSAILLL